MVLTVVGILYYLVSMALSFRTGILPGPLVVFVIAIVLGGIQLMLLISAQRASVHVSGMQAAYQAQYWQYLQQQQAYQQGTAAPPGYGAAPAYGANTYNAPPPGASGTATSHSGWQWTGQPTTPPIPPPIPLPPPPNDVDHDQQA
jgi:type II secretory pathway pseudopilin PulG